MNTWYKINSDEVLQQLNTNADRGLISTEVAHRLKQYGCNELTEQPGKASGTFCGSNSRPPWLWF